MNTDALWIAFPVIALSVLALVGATRGFARVVTAIHPLGHWLFIWPPTRTGLAGFGIGGLVLALALLSPFGRGLGIGIALLGLLVIMAGAIHDLLAWRKAGKADPYAAAAAARKRRAFGKSGTTEPDPRRRKRRRR